MFCSNKLATGLRTMRGMFQMKLVETFIDRCISVMFDVAEPQSPNSSTITFTCKRGSRRADVLLHGPLPGLWL